MSKSSKHMSDESLDDLEHMEIQLLLCKQLIKQLKATLAYASKLEEIISEKKGK